MAASSSTHLARRITWSQCHLHAPQFAPFSSLNPVCRAWILPYIGPAAAGLKAFGHRRAPPRFLLRFLNLVATTTMRTATPTSLGLGFQDHGYHRCRRYSLTPSCYINNLPPSLSAVEMAGSLTLLLRPAVLCGGGAMVLLFLNFCRGHLEMATVVTVVVNSGVNVSFTGISLFPLPSVLDRW